MPIRVKPGHPMLPARRVMKTWGASDRAGWYQLCSNKMAHWYGHSAIFPVCGANVACQCSPQCEPQRGVPVPACKACVRLRGGKL